MAKTNISGPDVIAMTLATGLAKPTLMWINRLMTVDALVTGRFRLTIGFDKVAALTRQLAV